VYAVAAFAGGEQETRAARLQSFFASVLSGLFGQGEGGQEEEEMDTRNHNAAAAAAPQLQHNRGEPPANLGFLLGLLLLFVLSSGDGFLGVFLFFLLLDYSIF
jgi:hypothetical protein